MRKVKPITKGYRYNLTFGKVYDVIKINTQDKKILLKNDLGNEEWYRTNGNVTNSSFFEDVSAEFRDHIIDYILS